MSGPSPIPTSEIESYLNLRNIWSPDEREGFLDFVVMLDDAFIEHDLSERKKKRGTGDKTSPTSPRTPKRR